MLKLLKLVENLFGKSVTPLTSRQNIQGRRTVCGEHRIHCAQRKKEKIHILNVVFANILNWYLIIFQEIP